MTTKDPVAAGVAAALSEGLAAAEREGATAVTAKHLDAAQLETLTAATLTHLRSVPGRPSDIEGWTRVTARDAAVMTWWTEIAGLTDGERRRLATLRRDVYDVLSERSLIEKDPDRSTSVHVSPAEPAATVTDPTDADPTDAALMDPETTETSTAGAGAWVLKLSPYLYDAHRVFAAADRRVHVWAVEDAARSASMRYGDTVYLWVGDGDPYLGAGVWGVGYVAGPTVLGVADDGWLDYQAASRASIFAVVDIRLLDVPVTREAFLRDAKLAEAEVIQDPYAPNPGLLTGSQAAALAEYLPEIGAPAEPRVA